MRKHSIYIILMIFLTIGVIYVVIASAKIDLINSFLPERLASFKNVHMEGRESSTEAWEVYAQEGWTGRDRNTTTFEHVTKAVITRNGRVLVSGLKARRMKVSKNKDVEVIKNVDKEPGYLSALIDFNAISNRKKKKQYSTLTAEDIHFNPDAKTAVVSGEVVIVKGKLIVNSDLVRMDLDRNIATFEGRSSFRKEGSRLFSNSATGFFDEDRIFMSGSVEVLQKNKHAVSDNAVYDDNSKDIVLTSRVTATIEKLRNAMKKESADRYKSEESKNALQEKTVITADKLIIYTDAGDSKAYGNVHVYQKEKEAKSDAADYSEKNETILLTGNVFMKKNDDWVKANKVIVYVDKDIFEAIGQVETTFKVKKGSHK